MCFITSLHWQAFVARSASYVSLSGDSACDTLAWRYTVWRSAAHRVLKLDQDLLENPSAPLVLVIVVIVVPLPCVLPHFRCGLQTI